MTRGTITNKQTGLEITGELTYYDDVPGLWFDFRITGTETPAAFRGDEWDFTPDPEPIKDGAYVYAGASPETAIILKRVNGEWRAAYGYALTNLNVDVSELVRLVPEA